MTRKDLSIIVFFILILSGCKKETLTLKTVEFTVQATDWYSFGSSYGFEKTVTEISDEVLSNGNITAYYTTNPSGGWTPLPFINNAGAASLRIAYSKEQISLGYFDLDGTTDPPTGVTYFKLVITTR